SQKRNRRRLIVEQLILLLLRVLLVLLAGLLLARFLGAANWLTGRSNFVHVVLLDDRLSMTDQWKAEGGERKNSWQSARETVEKLIAKQASGNRSAQTLIVRRLSEPNVDIFNDRLTDDSLRRLTATLNEMPDCTRLHLDLAKGVAATRDVFGKHTSD